MISLANMATIRRSLRPQLSRREASFRAKLEMLTTIGRHKVRRTSMIHSLLASTGPVQAPMVAKDRSPTRYSVEAPLALVEPTMAAVALKVVTKESPNDC